MACSIHLFCVLSLLSKLHNLLHSEPVLLNVYGASELMPRNEFRQPMQSGGPVRKPYSSSMPSPHRLFKNSSSDTNAPREEDCIMPSHWHSWTSASRPMPPISASQHPVSKSPLIPVQDCILHRHFCSFQQSGIQALIKTFLGIHTRVQRF